MELNNLDIKTKTNEQNKTNTSILETTTQIKKLIELIDIDLQNKKLKITDKDLSNEITLLSQKFNNILKIAPQKQIHKVCDGLYGYKNLDGKFQFFCIASNYEIKKLSFEFDSPLEVIDTDSGLFVGTISGETSIFQLDKNNFSLSYILKNPSIVDGFATYAKNLIIVEQKSKKYEPIEESQDKKEKDFVFEVIYKYENNNLIQLLDEGYVDLDIETNNLVTGANLIKKTNIIGTIDNNEFKLLKESDLTSTSHYQTIFDEKDKNSNSFIEILKNNGVLLNGYIYNVLEKSFKVIQNLYILGVSLSKLLTGDEIVSFLTGKMLLSVENKIFKFDEKSNLIVELKTFDKKSEIIKTQKSMFVPKKGFRYLKGVIYKLGILNLKQKQIKEIDKNNKDDLNNYFDEITL